MIPAIIIFFAQIGFIALRTVNVRYVAKGHLIGMQLSGLGVGVLWLLTTAMGVNAMMDFTENWLTVVGHLVGGLVGTWVGYKSKVFKNK